MLKYLTAAVLLAGLSTVSPAIAVTPTTNACLDGTAPEGWLRPGGYCEIAGLLDGALNVGKQQCTVVWKIGFACYVKTIVGNGPLHRTFYVFKNEAGDKVLLLRDPRRH